MHFESCGVLPRTVNDLQEARTELVKSGAVICGPIDCTEAGTRAFAEKMFGDRLRALPNGARVFEGGEHDITRVQATNLKTTPCHTDGFAYGDLYPDFILLSCVRESKVGGESILVDGYKVLEALAADPELAWAAIALRECQIDQTETGMQTSLSPICMDNGNGRIMVRRTLEQRPAETSVDPEKDQLMIELWHDSIDEASTLAPKFKLLPGQVVIVDNYRLMHGRRPYEDLNRMLWRVWVWSDDCLGVPPLRLASDTRYASSGGQNSDTKMMSSNLLISF